MKRIFKLFLEQKSLMAAVKELNRLGWRNKRWVSRKGKAHGGNAFNKNNLFGLLTNVLYVGKMPYKSEVHDGEHEAIVESETWELAQKLLRRNKTGRLHPHRYGALLKGLLFDEATGQPFYHTYTGKNGNRVRYRYYVNAAAQKHGWDTCQGTRSVAAGDIERYVVDQIRNIGQDPELAREVFRQSRVERDQRLVELKDERQRLEDAVRQNGQDIRQLVKQAGSEPNLTDRLAALGDSQRCAQERLAAVKDELSKLEKEDWNEDKLTSALAQFEPVWDALSLKEQARLIHLLVERVVYNGENNTVAIALRPNGIKALAEKEAKA